MEEGGVMWGGRDELIWVTGEITGGMAGGHIGGGIRHKRTRVRSSFGGAVIALASTRKGTLS